MIYNPDPEEYKRKRVSVTGVLFLFADKQVPEQFLCMMYNPEKNLSNQQPTNSHTYPFAGLGALNFWMNCLL